MMKCEWILCPVCGSKTRNKIWKDLGVEVQASEDEAIHILKPSDYIDNEGNQRTSYNVDYVYDISQTDAQPQPPQKPESNPKVLAIALMKSAAVPKVTVDELPIADSVAFDEYEQGVLLRVLNDKKSDLIKQGKATDAVDELIVKVGKAPTKKIQGA